jgi:hypothetical protein
MTGARGGNGRDRPLCGGSRRGANSGETCTRPAGWGTPTPGTGRCKLHGGNTPSHQQAVQRTLAVEAVKSYGIKSDLPPTAALLEEAQWSHGHVVWLRDVVQQIDPEALVWGKTEEHEKTASEFPGVDVKKLAAPNVWLKLYHEERRLHLDLVKTIETFKLEQRWQDLLHRNGELMRQVLVAVLARRGLPVDAGLASEIQDEIGRIAGPKTIEGRVA